MCAPKNKWSFFCFPKFGYHSKKATDGKCMSVDYKELLPDVIISNLKVQSSHNINVDRNEK